MVCFHLCVQTPHSPPLPQYLTCLKTSRSLTDKLSFDVGLQEHSTGAALAWTPIIKTVRQWSQIHWFKTYTVTEKRSKITELLNLHFSLADFFHVLYRWEFVLRLTFFSYYPNVKARPAGGPSTLRPSRDRKERKFASETTWFWSACRRRDTWYGDSPFRTTLTVAQRERKYMCWSLKEAVIDIGSEIIICITLIHRSFISD